MRYLGKTFAAVTLTCCVMLGSGPAGAAEGKRIFLLSGPIQDRFLNAFTQEFTTAAKLGGASVTLLTSPYDAALQAQQIDDAIGQHPDIIVLQPLSSKAVTPALTRARAAGVKVFLVISPLDGDENLYAGRMGLDDVKSGAMAAEALIDGLVKSGRTKAKVAALTGTLAEGIAPLRLKGFRERLSKETWIDLVQVEDARWNPQVTERIAGQLFARYAGQGGLDGLYGMNDAQANAIIQAAESAGLKPGRGPGDLVVVGGGCQETGIRNIRAGKQIATLSGPLPSYDGPTAAKRVFELFDGQLAERVSMTPLERITSENLEKFAKACSF